MADTSPNLGFKRLEEAQDDAEVFVNENYNLADALIHLAVEDQDLSAAPTGVNGKVYIIAGTPAGGDPWEGQTAGTIAIYYDGWIFVTPKEGMKARIKDENIDVTYDGTSWCEFYAHSVESGITASTTQTQGQQPLTAEINQVGTVTNADDVVTLMPADFDGREITVINSGANALQVFPASGDRIDNQSQNQSVSIPAGDAWKFLAVDNENWYTMKGS